MALAATRLRLFPGKYSAPIHVRSTPIERTANPSSILCANRAARTHTAAHGPLRQTRWEAGDCPIQFSRDPFEPKGTVGAILASRAVPPCDRIITANERRAPSMPKLKTLRPLVATMPPRIQSQRETRDRAQPQTNLNAYRQWYKSARWQRLRQEVLARDIYTCQHTGVILSGRANAPDSPVFHHKVPHKGDEQLFWDINNLEAVSKQWHDSEAQAQERRA